ncbi:UNVERIFIED_CONTAM: hypothetical protein Sangu_0666700 [Sesamum angustifolium]|uniref:Uncharacterized protein n=1 Tax=Sesamum angustifolium TaxID=2727405 RepID=A0AAW2QCZ4_9LAMI
MATALSVRPTRAISGSDRLRPTSFHRPAPEPIVKVGRRGPWGLLFSRRILAAPLQAGSRADDSAPFEMSVENASKYWVCPRVHLSTIFFEQRIQSLLLVKMTNKQLLRTSMNAAIFFCLVYACINMAYHIQVEAAYDMLLMQSLSRRRAGKVVNSSIRYADVKSINSPKMGPMPKWLQTSVKKSPISVEAPSTSELGVQAGVYGALMVLTYANGASPSSTIPYGGSDVPGLILATSFGASLYFMTKNIKNKTKAYELFANCLGKP